MWHWYRWVEHLYEKFLRNDGIALSLFFLTMGVLWDAVLKDLMFWCNQRLGLRKEDSSIFGLHILFCFNVGVFHCFWNRQHFINWKLIDWLVSYQTDSLCSRLKSQGPCSLKCYFQLSPEGKISFRTLLMWLMLQSDQPVLLKNLYPKALKHQWERKWNLKQFACTTTSEWGPPASFGTIEILLPGVDLFQDFATEKADLQGLVSFQVRCRGRVGTSVPNFVFYSKALNR